MTTLAVYLFFVGALTSYRSSKYWPADWKAISWLGNVWWRWGSILLPICMLVINKGWGIGLLLSLTLMMSLFSSVMFFANCNRLIRSMAVILFHVGCFLGLILNL